MSFPLAPPITPMLAKAARSIPRGPFLYEPKWDGFRCIVYRDDDEVELGSRSERSLTRYFPEILDPLRAALPARSVVDGELVIATPHGLDFELLGRRIHPADSRVQRLARETPSAFVAFDLLAQDDLDWRPRPLAERRIRLDALLADARLPVVLSPATTDAAEAQDWFERFEGAGFDGVIAKRVDAPYETGVRGWIKVKHERTADCVVAGFRMHTDGQGVGSLLLGLFDGVGRLQHVGVASSFSSALRVRLLADVRPHTEVSLETHPWAGGAGAGQRVPGEINRWNAQRMGEWIALAPALVAEVRYEHLQRPAGEGGGGYRFRHNARFSRWRPDRDPESCTFDQLDQPVPVELHALFGA